MGPQDPGQVGGAGTVMAGQGEGQVGLVAVAGAVADVVLDDRPRVGPVGVGVGQGPDLVVEVERGAQGDGALAPSERRRCRGDGLAGGGPQGGGDPLGQRGTGEGGWGVVAPAGPGGDAVGPLPGVGPGPAQLLVGGGQALDDRGHERAHLGTEVHLADVVGIDGGVEPGGGVGVAGDGQLGHGDQALAAAPAVPRRAPGPAHLERPPGERRAEQVGDALASGPLRVAGDDLGPAGPQRADQVRVDPGAGVDVDRVVGRSAPGGASARRPGGPAPVRAGATVSIQRR